MPPFQQPQLPYPELAFAVLTDNIVRFIERDPNQIPDLVQAFQTNMHIFEQARLIIKWPYIYFANRVLFSRLLYHALDHYHGLQLALQSDRSDYRPNWFRVRLRADSAPIYGISPQGPRRNLERFSTDLCNRLEFPGGRMQNLLITPNNSLYGITCFREHIFTIIDTVRHHNLTLEVGHAPFLGDLRLSGLEAMIPEYQDNWAQAANKWGGPPTAFLKFLGPWRHGMPPNNNQLEAAVDALEDSE